MTVFGYLISIALIFIISFLRFLLSFNSAWEDIKHLRQCLTTFPNTSTIVKNTPLRFVSSTIFLAFGNIVKHGFSCLIYFIKTEARNQTMLHDINSQWRIISSSTFLLLFSLYSAKLQPSWLYVTKYCVTHCAASCRPCVAIFTTLIARRKSTW